MIGTEWSLRAFDDKGAPLWTRSVPSIARAVNITGDGRLVVAAYGDGTIRWHRMSDGVELLAFMPLADRTNWVGWTPEGFYAATGGAHGFLRWHVNRGWDAPAESVPVTDIPGSFRSTASSHPFCRARGEKSCVLQALFLTRPQARRTGLLLPGACRLV